MALGGRPSIAAPSSWKAIPRCGAFAEEIAALDPAAQRERLADSGYLVPHWPRPYGLDASPAQQLVIDDEFTRAGVRRPDLVIGAWAGPTILRHGTAEQQERFVHPTLRGEITWCQLFSEPEAGSDLAVVAHQGDAGPTAAGGSPARRCGPRSRTRPTGRSASPAPTPTSPKHKGITYFLVDMRTPGIDVRPLREITGEARFNEVFLDDVFVPDDCVVGAVNDGWRLTRTTLANERVAMGSALGEAAGTAAGSPGRAGRTRNDSGSWWHRDSRCPCSTCERACSC